RGKIWRLDARVRAFALERLDQTRFFTADVSAGATVDENFAAILGAENFRPAEIRRASFRDRLLQDSRAMRHLAADVDVGLLYVIRPAGDHDPLDQLMRVLVNDVAVLERAGLRLVRV